jgi:hypothetical protein
MEVLGYPPSLMEVLGYPPSLMEVLGYPPSLMDVLGYPPSLMEVLGYPPSSSHGEPLLPPPAPPHEYSAPRVYCACGRHTHRDDEPSSSNSGFKRSRLGRELRTKHRREAHPIGAKTCQADGAVYRRPIS